MSPSSQDPSTRQRKQLPGREPQVRRRARQPRSRECLLKGCRKIFRPRHAMARYCSEECRRKARQWSQWKSRQRWRHSENGRKKRRQQSIRHRERLRMTGQVPSGGKAARVGHHKPQRAKIFWRHLRPSRLLRFCSHECRRALERVLQRERRWKERGPGRIVIASRLAARSAARRL